MTDRIKGLTVTLRPDMRDDDCESIVNAICLLKGVIDVTKHVANVDHHFAVVAAKQAMRKQIEAIVWD